MSLAAKATFTLCCATTAGIIYYVHYRQEADRRDLHKGVELDIERQRQRKIQNLYMLEQQKQLTKQLRAQQKEENIQAA